VSSYRCCVMDLKGLNVLIDGLNLEYLQGTGIKTYGISLIEALKHLGANPNVLISKYSVKQDKEINTDILALFQELTVKPWLRFNYMLVAKTLCGFSETAKSIPIPKDLILTQGAEGFSFINDVNIYASRGCYKIADTMRYFGFKAKIKTHPKMDIWHTTYFTPITVPGAAKISTIHDLVPLRLPHTTINDKGIFVQQIRDALKSSQLIICVSENTKKDILQFFDVNPDKLFVTYQPINLNKKLPEKETIVRKLTYYNLKYKNYILFVGAIEPKKNIKRLIEAYLSMDMDLPLVIVGKKAWLWESELNILSATWNKKQIRRKIRTLEYLPVTDLSVLYTGAQCLAFPSLYEGFGLPPLEAMSLGCPVITSSISSLPEICGDAALYVNPYDTKDIADKLAQILNDDELKAKLVTAGYERAQQFGMKNYMKRLTAAYRKVC
jgi:glycosyltransferase involved in cell wall biosynthesis